MLVLASRAAAQSVERIPPGTRVRVTAGGDRVTGSVMASSGDSLTWMPDRNAQPVSLAWARVDALEVSDGRHGHVWEGLAAGVVGGAALGAGVGALFADPGFFSRGDITAAGALVGASAGALLGVLIGSAVRTERWQPRAMVHARVALAGSLRMEVSVAF